MQDLGEKAREELDWPAWRDAVGEVRRHTVAHLDHYLEQFAANVERRGGSVFCAADAAEAREYVAELARRKGARLIVKSKSMVTEEIGLNPALEADGAEVVETDLGEFIIQLCGERPFHIVAPAIHKTLEQIRELFCSLAGERLPADPDALTRVRAPQTAREVPQRRHGHHRRQLRRRRHRHDRPRDQRGQRPHDDHAATHARGRHGHRAPGAGPRESRGHPHRAPLGRGRRAHHLVRHGHHRPAQAGRRRRPRRAPRRARRQRPVGDPRFGLSGDPALHPLRGVSRRLPRVPSDRRSRLRLHVLRSHRRGPQPPPRRALSGTWSCPSRRASAAPAARSARRGSR